MARLKVTYATGETEVVETDDVATRLAELTEPEWIDRGTGRFSRVTQVEVLDDAQHEDALRRFRESRLAFGKGLGRAQP